MGHIIFITSSMLYIYLLSKVGVSIMFIFYCFGFAGSALMYVSGCIIYRGISWKENFILRLITPCILQWLHGIWMLVI